MRPLKPYDLSALFPRSNSNNKNIVIQHRIVRVYEFQHTHRIVCVGMHWSVRRCLIKERENMKRAKDTNNKRVSLEHRHYVATYSLWVRAANSL